MSQESQVQCKACNNNNRNVFSQHINLCYCYYHKECLQNLLSYLSRKHPEKVKVQSFRENIFSMQCPKCEQPLPFTTSLIKRNCDWCHVKSYYRTSKLEIILNIIVIISGLLLLGLGVFVVWNYGYAFELNDWKKYLVCGVFLFLVLILLFKLSFIIYFSLGMWVENKVILVKEKQRRESLFEDENKLKNARIVKNSSGGSSKKESEVHIDEKIEKIQKIQKMKRTENIQKIEQKEEEKQRTIFNAKNIKEEQIKSQAIEGQSQQISQIITLQVESDLKNDENIAKKATRYDGQYIKSQQDSNQQQ